MEVIFEPVMMGWGQVILYVLTLAISYNNRPKPPSPPDAVAQDLEGFDVPTAEDGKPVPVLWGRRQIKSPNVIWYGDLKTDPITQRVQ